MRQGPLAGRYPAVAAMVMAALIPYLALSAALDPLTGIISSQLHMSLQTLSLGSGLGNAAYAVGTVLAVQFAQHLPQRRMMIVYAVALVIGSFLQATAQDAAMFLAGHILQGLCTSLLLIAAVPTLAIGFPRARLKTTAVVMNMCIFGAVALGPLVGGVQAQAHAWRPLFWIVSGISVVALLLAVATFEDAPPANPDSPVDLPAIGLAAVGCFAAFIGAAELTTHKFLDGLTIVPLLGGLGVIVILITYQTLSPRPLLTIKQMLVSSIPVAGIGVALFAAAASVSATALTVGVLAPHYSAAHIGLLFLPEVGGAVVTAIALGIVIDRRSVHYLPLIGMVALAAGIAVFRIEVPSSQALSLVGSGLTGIGLGATVAPALFVAGFSLPSANLQRVFAIVELLRAVAAFMIAPIFVHFASTVGGNLVKGTSIALWIGLGLALGGAAFGVVVYWLSGARPQTPDLDAFLEGDEPAWFSPPLLAVARGVDVTPPVHAPGPAPTWLQPVMTTAQGVASELGAVGAPVGALVADGAVAAVSAGGGMARTPSNERSPAVVGAPVGARAAHGGSGNGVAGDGSPFDDRPQNGSAGGDVPGNGAASLGAGDHGTAALDVAARRGGSATDRSTDGETGLAASATGAAATRERPVLLVYDGTHLSAQAIRQAGEQLAPGRAAIVLTVWAPGNVGFRPADQHFDADCAPEVRRAADTVAEKGAELAHGAGFNVRPATVEANETWKGIVHAAEDHDASLIVMGSHRHSGVTGHLAGSVANAVVAHATAPVLLVHPD